MPFGNNCEYANFAACVAANQDKDSPEGWCAALQKATEGKCKRMTTTAPEKRAARPPLADVTREAPFRLRAVSEELPNDGFTLDGYGAVFNRVTIIDSWEGRFKEKIASGSMKKTFKENPPRIQFDHGRHPLVGSIPIAELKRAAEEVDPEFAPEGGAHVLGRLFDNWLILPVRDAIAAKAIRGMSFRFEVVKEKWEDSEGKVIKDEETLMELLMKSWFSDLPEDELLTRTLQELRVPEIGPVVWPAYEETSVSVRSQVIDLSKLDDLAERRKVAVLLFAAEAAGRMNEKPEVTANRAADDHSSDETDDAPGVTANRAADDHSPDVDDTPQSTELGSSAGTHESGSDDQSDSTDQDRALNDALAEVAQLVDIKLI